MEAPKFIVEIRPGYASDQAKVKAIIEAALEAEFGPDIVKVIHVNASAVQKLASEWS